MELKLLKKDKEKFYFLIKGTNPDFVNALRRIITNSVPTLAIDEVTIKTNSSALYDEIVAHRLGLVPLKSDLKSYTLHTDCKCKGEGCEHCQVHLKLKAKGPCIVYSGDLKSQDPKIVPAIDKIPITKLLEGQELDIIATAVLGQGSEHIKFAPGLAYFQGYPIKILKDDKEILFTGTEKEALETANILVEGSKENFIFKIESFGQLKPEQIMNKAVETFQKKLKDFDKAINKLK